MRTDIDWAAHMEAVARRLYGEPNKHLSKPGELRFGSHGSLRVTIAGPHRGTWRNFELDVGGGVLDLIRHKRGLSNGGAVEWLKSELHLDTEEPRVQHRDEPQRASADIGRVVAAYDYFDERRQLLYRVTRREYRDGSKSFFQNPPDGKGGWIKGSGCMEGVRRVPYRLPELLAEPDRTVFAVEGEKCVNRLLAIGLLATCNPGGCKTSYYWGEFAEFFRGRDIVVIPDNDEVGLTHANEVVRHLLSVAESVRLLILEGLPPKGDVYDWLDAGHTREELIALAGAAHPVRQAPKPANVVRGNFRKAREASSDDEPIEDAPEMFGEPLNDIGNAKRLIAQHGTAMRYVVSIGWHVWDGRRYLYDPATVDARRLAHDTAREMLTHAFDMPDRNKEQSELRKTLIKFAVASGNTSKINGMLSQAEPHLCVTTDDLDRDPWLLNCDNGTLDLRTRELRPHSQSDLLTKLAPVSYDPHAECPTWERVMAEVFNKDNDMISYVKRAIGYSITGLTTEQVIFIMHGAGSNGKSLMLEIVASILGDYAMQCASDTFVDNNKGGGIPNDIARLVGARLVSAVETEQDRKLQEAMIKQATGGDRLTARFMRQEFFEFVPNFKLWMATNHKPRVRGTDNAIWRRIRLLPFLVIFSDPEEAKEGQPVKDFTLKDKLMKERSGILKWMVDGCIKWQEEGLRRAPKVVTEAITEYRESQDATAGFVAEYCHVAPSVHAKVGSLYKAYRNWCIENGETPLSSVSFGLALEEKGFASKKGTGGVRVRNGLTLKLEFDPDQKSEGSGEGRE
jgi:putative DNA primase/helicase